MDGHDLLDALRGMTEFEAVGDSPQTEQPIPLRQDAPDFSGCVTHVMAGSRKMPVLKSMMTSACERDCFYCPFRAGRSAMRRRTFSPDDMAHGFMHLYRAGAVEGIFLSSGVIHGGVTTQDKILDTGAILREKLGYRGYMHLKIMPGAERDQVLRAMQLADRVSVNLEAPNPQRLARIAPLKQFASELLTPLKWVEEIRRESAGRLAASSTTEFVVGAAGESDVEILSASEYLFRELRLARTYYSAFRPVPDTPFDNLAPTDSRRQHRLYQASFMLRDYDFDLEEMPFLPDGQLPLAVDPKQAWADANLRDAPLEINTASRRDLLRVPGIGVVGAGRILAARRTARLRALEDLTALGLTQVGRAADYVLLDGRRPVQQMRLF